MWNSLKKWIFLVFWKELNKLREEVFGTADFETERANARRGKFAAQRETAGENRWQPGRSQNGQQGLSADQWKLKY